MFKNAYPALLNFEPYAIISLESKAAAPERFPAGKATDLVFKIRQR
jgi:hypothetical protein